MNYLIELLFYFVANNTHLPLPNFVTIPSVGRSGGLWLLWYADIAITILEKSFYFIFVRIENVLWLWILSLIYGDPYHVISDYIWDRVFFYSQSHLPLCLMGDFNSILMSCEKMGVIRKITSKWLALIEWCKYQP